MYQLDYKEHVVRAAAILTTSYVAGTVISDVHLGNQLIVLLAFTKGDLTTAEIKVEFSNDGTTYYQETAESFTAGAGTLSLAERAISATGNYRIAIPIRDRYIQISVKGTGTVDGSSMAVKAIVGSV